MSKNLTKHWKSRSMIKDYSDLTLEESRALFISRYEEAMGVDRFNIKRVRINYNKNGILQNVRPVMEDFY